MPSGKKRTHKDFITEFNKNNPHHDSIKIIGEYEKNIDPILCKCRICGYEWSPTPKTLISGHGCPKCNNNLKLTNEEFIKKLKDCNPNYNNFELLEKYNGMSKKIKCRCKVCNTIWYPKANDLIRAKSGCPSCSGKIQYTHQKFVSEIKKKNINYEQIELLGEYKGSLERIKCRCKICGCIWEPIASSLIQGTGCPKCAEKRVAEKGKDILRKLPKSTPISHSDFLREIC